MGAHLGAIGGEVVALKDRLPVRPARSIDPTHGRRVLTRVWDRREEGGELEQLDIRGTIYVNPDKRGTSSLPYAIRYDDTEESDEEIDLDCLGKDLFFEEDAREVPAPHVRTQESQSDLSEAAAALTIHTDE
eukprot:641592-Pyramimonas_sp.AAC.1